MGRLSELIDNVTLEDNGDYINFHVGRHTIAQRKRSHRITQRQEQYRMELAYLGDRKGLVGKTHHDNRCLRQYLCSSPDHSWLLQRTRKITQKEHKGEIRV